MNFGTPSSNRRAGYTISSKAALMAHTANG
jgi:hypothetical protein